VLSPAQLHYTITVLFLGWLLQLVVVLIRVVQLMSATVQSETLPPQPPNPPNLPHSQPQQKDIVKSGD